MEGSPEAALDAAALELLAALETLQERRQLLGQLLRQGWLSLSEARYSLGCHRVSSLQYGATMVPRVRVLPRQDPGGPPRFEEVPGTGGDPEDPDGQRGGGDGVTVAVEVAGLQSAVAAATARYRALLRRKRHLDGDTGTPGDSETPGDTKSHRDSETVGDTETLRDTGTPCDTEITGDTETRGDTESHGDTKTHGDTESYRDTKTTEAAGDTETMGDTVTSRDTVTA